MAIRKAKHVEPITAAQVEPEQPVQVVIAVPVEVIDALEKKGLDPVETLAKLATGELLAVKPNNAYGGRYK